MKTLHNNYDASGLLVIQSAVQRVVKPLIHPSALGFRECFIRLQGIINDNEVCTPAGQHTCHGGREPEAVLGRYKLLYGLLTGPRSGPLGQTEIQEAASPS